MSDRNVFTTANKSKEEQLIEALAKCINDKARGEARVSTALETKEFHKEFERRVDEEISKLDVSVDLAKQIKRLIVQ